MVHPVDVVLRDKGLQGPVEFPRGLLSGAKGLLHDEPRSGRDLVRGQYLAGLLADLGRQREVDGHGHLHGCEQGGQFALGGDVNLVVTRGLTDPLQFAPPGGVGFGQGIGEGSVDAFQPLFLRPRG